MVVMRLGGIDPSILRELSGVYKPFLKALKELVSNAFDADADVVRVVFADDFSSVTATDNGQGMTPFEFRNDFARISVDRYASAVKKFFPIPPQSSVDSFRPIAANYPVFELIAR